MAIDTNSYSFKFEQFSEIITDANSQFLLGQGRSEALLFRLGIKFCELLPNNSSFRQELCKIARVKKFNEDETYFVALEKVCKQFNEFKKNCHSPMLRRKLGWLTFQNLDQSLPKTRLPEGALVLKNETFKINFGIPYWGEINPLSGCFCPKSCPAGIDLFADTVADELKGEKSIVLIDFGSGDALPTLALLTRLRDKKKVTTILIDSDYKMKESPCTLILSKGKFHCKGERFPPESLKPFLQLCFENFYSANHDAIGIFHIYSSTESFLEHFKDYGDRCVLYAVDPPSHLQLGSYIPDYQKVAKFLVDTTDGVGFYFLNQTVSPNDVHLTREQALNGDVVFKPKKKNEEEKY